MRIVCDTQRNPEWFQAHVGRVTASRVSDVMAKLACETGADCLAAKHDKCKRKVCACLCHNGDRTPGEAASRENYKWQKVAEILSGCFDERNYVSSYMQDGIDYEDFARASYEILTDNAVQQTGFILHPTNDRCGASPDGLVGSDGMIEIKVQQPYIHLQCLYGDVIPQEYVPQMQHGMLCAERRWCDFVSYCQSLPQPYRTFIKRVKRDEALIAIIEAEIGRFFVDVDAIVAQLSAGVVLPAKPESESSLDQLAAQDMRDLEATWQPR